MAIGGLISFHSNDADNLPVSTTKTGIEMESEIYDHALSICADAIKTFTSFTNKWKGRIRDTTQYFEKAKRKDAYLDVRIAGSKGRRMPRTGGRRYKPQLPTPKADTSMRRISYARPIKELEAVSDYLFNEQRAASEVGEECFVKLLAEAKTDRLK